MFRKQYSSMDLKGRGSFIIARLTGETVSNLVDFCRKHNITKFVKPPFNYFHITLLNTIKDVPTILRQYTQNVTLTPHPIEIMRHYNGLRRMAILPLENAYIEERRQSLCSQYNLAIPPLSFHITLSYDCDDWKPNTLLVPDFPIKVEGESRFPFEFEDNQDKRERQNA